MLNCFKCSKERKIGKSCVANSCRWRCCSCFLPESESVDVIIEVGELHMLLFKGRGLFCWTHGRQAAHRAPRRAKDRDGAHRASGLQATVHSLSMPVEWISGMFTSFYSPFLRAIWVKAIEISLPKACKQLCSSLQVCVSSQIGCKMGCSFCATGAAAHRKMKDEGRSVFSCGFACVLMEKNSFGSCKSSLGTMGLMGQLSAGEILEQLLHAKRFARL